MRNSSGLANGTKIISSAPLKSFIISSRMYSKYCPPNNVEVDAKSMFILYLLNRRTKIKLLRIVEGRTHIIFSECESKSYLCESL